MSFYGTNVLPVLQNLFHVAPGNMRLYYYDQEMSKVAGPEEMKWNSKVCACAKKIIIRIARKGKRRLIKYSKGYGGHSKSWTEWKGNIPRRHKKSGR